MEISATQADLFRELATMTTVPELAVFFMKRALELQQTPACETLAEPFGEAEPSFSMIVSSLG
jgi:hypothetical protein